jgi:TolA-binding protein
MAYAEVFLGKDVDWNTYLNKDRAGVFPNRQRHIPPNPAVPLDDNEEDIAGAMALMVAAVDPATVQAGLQGPNLVEAMDVGHEGGLQYLDQRMIEQPMGELDGLVGGEAIEGLELEQLRQRLAAMQVESVELESRHRAELQAQMAQVKALTEENAKLVASNNDLLARASRLSIEGVPPLDDVVDMATYGLVEAEADPPIANPFMVRSRNTFPPTHFRGESSNATAQPTIQEGEEMIHISKII